MSDNEVKDRLMIDAGKSEAPPSGKYRFVEYRCRPADPAYHDDPYYEKTVRVTAAPRSSQAAACEFAEQRCQQRSEYTEEDVQVLVGDVWETFEITIRSVPEFSATPKKAKDSKS